MISKQHAEIAYRTEAFSLSNGFSLLTKLNSKKWAKQILLIFAIYTLYILVLLFQSYGISLRSKTPISLLESAELMAVWGYTWALLTPLIGNLGRRLPASGRNLIRNLLLHLCIGIVFAVIHRAVFIFFQQLIAPGTFMMPQESIARIFWLAHYVSDGLFQYIFIATVYQAYLHFQAAQERQFRLQQAELQGLKAQLHPHFLFNTLNAVAALGFSQPEAASKLIAELSDLLRFALKSEKAAETTLKEELAFLYKYVKIQQTMLQERLLVEWSVAPDALDALVPNMILQPLVENSIRHGIEPKESGGSIKIIVRKTLDTLYLQISDDGLGLAAIGSKTAGTGIGLENTRARLKHFYGESHQFELTEPHEGGVTVRMTIPYKEIDASGKLRRKK